MKQNNEEVRVYNILYAYLLVPLPGLCTYSVEVVTDLTTATFLLVFCCFVSRRSLPTVMMSDNANTYTSAAEELTRLFTSEELSTVLGWEGIRWKFIPHGLEGIGRD